MPKTYASIINLSYHLYTPKHVILVVQDCRNIDNQLWFMDGVCLNEKEDYFFCFCENKNDFVFGQDKMICYKVYKVKSYSCIKASI